MPYFITMVLFAGISIPNVFAQQVRVVEDFERYEVGNLPHLWKIPDRASRSMLPIPQDHAKPDDFVKIVQGDRGHALRAYTQGESVQIALPQGALLPWNLNYFPFLRWRWRADKLPVGATERSRSLNDTGAALYVAFPCSDWLGRPCTIKYTYSSTLPIGSRHRYGKLHVVVVSTASEGLGEWVEVQRNVADDYRMVFNREPSGNPIYIMIWSDSDNTDGEADVYFDDIVIASEE